MSRTTKTIDLVRAWKDPEFRAGLSQKERAQLPSTPPAWWSWTTPISTRSQAAGSAGSAQRRGCARARPDPAPSTVKG